MKAFSRSGCGRIFPLFESPRFCPRPYDKRVPLIGTLSTRTFIMVRGSDRNSDTEYMAATDQSPEDHETLAMQEPSIHGSRTMAHADWFRDALADRGTRACIPSKSNRKIQIPHDRTRYSNRYKIENMFGKLKDWRRIHTRYDRCAQTFLSAIAIAATVIFWL